MSDDLSSNERAVLLTLLVHGPTLSGPEMKKLARLTLDREEREHLNKLQYVESVKGRSFTHTVTEDGRKRCIDDLVAGAPPARGSALERSLYAVLGIIGKSVDIQSLFGSARDAEEVEAAIRLAYKKLRRERGGWVSLADLRDELGGVAPEVVDGALKRLNRQPGVVLVPESDQTLLTKRQRDAALKLGGQLKHLISVEGV